MCTQAIGYNYHTVPYYILYKVFGVNSFGHVRHLIWQDLRSDTSILFSIEKLFSD